MVVGCQLSQATELGEVPGSLSGSFLDVDGRGRSDVSFPEGLDSFIFEASTKCDGLNVCFLGDEAGSGLTIWHLEGVDGLEGGLNAGVLKVAAGVENVIANS